MCHSEESRLLTAQETLEYVRKLTGIEDVYITLHNRVQFEAFGSAHDWAYDFAYIHDFDVWQAVDDRMNGRPYVLIQLATSDMVGDSSHVARLKYAGWIDADY